MEKFNQILGRAIGFPPGWLSDSASKEHQEWRYFAEWGRPNSGGASWMAEPWALTSQNNNSPHLSACCGCSERNPATADVNVSRRPHVVPASMLATSPQRGSFSLFGWHDRSSHDSSKKEATISKLGLLSSPFASLVGGHSWEEKEDSKSLPFTVEEQANIARFRTIVPISMLSFLES